MSLRSSLLLLSFAAPAAWAAHPLITEDTGTQGKGGWQLELSTDRVRDGNEQATVSQMTLSYGFAETADLQVGIPYVGGSPNNGKGDLAIEVKWRFWEREHLSLGVKPGVTLPTGDANRGLGQGRATYGALLFASYDPGPWAAHVQAGYRRNENSVGEARDLTQYSGSLWYRPVESVRLVGEVGWLRASTLGAERHERLFSLGVIWTPRKDLDLDLGWRRGQGELFDRVIGGGITFRW